MGKLLLMNYNPMTHYELHDKKLSIQNYLLKTTETEYENVLVYDKILHQNTTAKLINYLLYVNNNFSGSRYINYFSN